METSGSVAEATINGKTVSVEAKQPGVETVYISRLGFNKGSFKVYVTDQPEDLGWPSNNSALLLWNSQDREYLCTADPDEKDQLLEQGWTIVTTDQQLKSSDSIYRLYNSYADDYLYTTNESEREVLTKDGWIDEGACIKTIDAGGPDWIPIFSLFNLSDGEHFLTCDVYEYINMLKSDEWADNWVTFNVLESDSELGSPVYEFTNNLTGTQLFTGNEATRDILSAHPAYWTDKGSPFKSVSPSEESDPAILSFSPAALSVARGRTGSVTVAGHDGGLVATSSDDSIAKVDVSGSTITVTGVAAGTAEIAVRNASGDLALGFFTVTVTASASGGSSSGGGTPSVPSEPEAPDTPAEPDEPAGPTEPERPEEPVVPEDPVNPTQDEIADSSTNQATADKITEEAGDFADVSEPEKTVDAATGETTVSWKVEVTDESVPAERMGSSVLGNILAAVRQTVGRARSASAVSLQDPGVYLDDFIHASEERLNAFYADCIRAAQSVHGIRTFAEGDSAIETAGDLVNKTASVRVTTNGGEDSETSVVYTINFTSADSPALDETEAVYRLYNPYDGIHLYTTDANEMAELEAAGWQLDGQDGKPLWYAPASGDDGAFLIVRLYNPYSHDHYYCRQDDANQIQTLTGKGWIQESEASSFYSAPAGSGTVIHTLFNPWSKTDTHLWTPDANEVATLVKPGGWQEHKTEIWAVGLPA